MWHLRSMIICDKLNGKCGGIFKCTVCDFVRKGRRKLPLCLGGVLVQSKNHKWPLAFQDSIWDRYTWSYLVYCIFENISKTCNRPWKLTFSGMRHGVVTQIAGKDLLVQWHSVISQMHWILIYSSVYVVTVVCFSCILIFVIASAGYFSWYMRKLFHL